MTKNPIVYVDGHRYSPVDVLEDDSKQKCIECRKVQCDDILDLIKNYIDEGRLLLQDYSADDLKISQVEAEGYLRAAITIFQRIKELKDYSN
jgi:hypothetical protein